jgi:hypothetical protein
MIHYRFAAAFRRYIKHMPTCSKYQYAGDIYFCQANGAMPNMHAEMIIVNCLKGNVAALVFGSYELAPCPCCAVTLDEMGASVSGVRQAPNLGWIHPIGLWGIQKNNSEK